MTAIKGVEEALKNRKAMADTLTDEISAFVRGSTEAEILEELRKIR